VPFASKSYVGWDDNDVGGGNPTTRRFNGLIDEPMIFGRTLAPSEINALYSASLAERLTIVTSGGKVILTWPGGTLQQAAQVTGPYNDMTGVTSPYTNSPSGQTYYRVKVH
jgi:hypothetical protein